jgi:hypothetical protein
MLAPASVTAAIAAPTAGVAHPNGDAVGDLVLSLFAPCDAVHRQIASLDIPLGDA